LKAPGIEPHARDRDRALAGAVRACVLALMLGAAQARGAGTTDAGAAFLQKAAEANAAEIKTSQAAQTRAVDPAVKAFADRMVDEHTANEHALDALAKKRNVAVGADPDPDRQIRIGSLQKLKGPAFDHAYVKTMIDDHAATIGLFEDAAHTLDDAEIRQFVDATLPVLREHAKAAKALPH
jgi:putative membrane protein